MVSHKGVPGSHTILVSDKREFTDLAISEAAIIAACNSSAKENTKVPVDYTLVKNVKKPSVALPGKVVYYTNNMIYVIADKTKITEKFRLSRTFSFMLFFRRYRRIQFHFA